MASPEWLTIREAWARALYGPGGFYLSERPADHFRTSPHASTVFAEAIGELSRHWAIDSVVDLGAGRGELLVALHGYAPDLDLLGVDLRPRPADLPAQIGWVLSSGRELPPRSGDRILVLANEVLDNIPCDSVELDARGVLRVVEVNVHTGEARLGEQAEPSIQAWVERWWDVIDPGDRAEVGLPRDDWWADVVANWDGAVCAAVDYGHVAAHRPVAPTLASYRHGRAYDPTFDTAHDLTAHVAVDAVADRTGALVRRQRDVLQDLGLTGARPPIELAEVEPLAYVQELSRATQIAELTGSPGLGDFWWIVSGQPVGA